jgi:hypothetical protein
VYLEVSGPEIKDLKNRLSFFQSHIKAHLPYKPGIVELPWSVWINQLKLKGKRRLASIA